MCLPASATTFQLQGLDQQLKEADGVLMGHFLKSRSVELENGRIATQMIFKMQKEYGLQSELFGMDEVIIHYPGGQIGDQRVEVQGTPKFIPGEKVVIFTRSHNNRYWGLNLGMGTYKIINYGKENMLVNTIFPQHPQIGQYPVEEFEKSVRAIKGSHLRVVLSNSHPVEITNRIQERSPASATEGKKRTVASEREEVDNNAASSSFRTFWLLAFLAFLGTCFRFMQRKGHK